MLRYLTEQIHGSLQQINSLVKPFTLWKKKKRHQKNWKLAIRSYLCTCAYEGTTCQSALIVQPSFWLISCRCQLYYIVSNLVLFFFTFCIVDSCKIFITSANICNWVQKKAAFKRCFPTLMVFQKGKKNIYMYIFFSRPHLKLYEVAVKFPCLGAHPLESPHWAAESMYVSQTVLSQSFHLLLYDSQIIDKVWEHQEHVQICRLHKKRRGGGEEKYMSLKKEATQHTLHIEFPVLRNAIQYADQGFFFLFLPIPDLNVNNLCKSWLSNCLPVCGLVKRCARDMSPFVQVSFLFLIFILNPVLGRCFVVNWCGYVLHMSFYKPLRVTETC